MGTVVRIMRRDKERGEVLFIDYFIASIFVAIWEIMRALGVCLLEEKKRKDLRIREKNI